MRTVLYFQIEFGQVGSKSNSLIGLPHMEQMAATIKIQRWSKRELERKTTMRARVSGRWREIQTVLLISDLCPPV